MFMEKSRRIIKDTDKCRKTKPYQGYFVSLYNNNSYQMICACSTEYSTGAVKNVSNTSRYQVIKEGEMVGINDAALEQEGKPDPYNSDLFVERKPELNLIESKVEQGRLKNAIREPLVSFFGVGGNGKTWLMRHLQEKYRFQANQIPSGDKPTATIYFDCDEVTDDSLQTLSAFLLAFSHALQVELAAQLPPLPVLDKLKSFRQQSEDIANILVEILLALSKEYVLLFLIDTTELILSELWPLIEKELFEPLLESNQIIILLSGRHYAPRWKRVEVRRRADHSHVQPFTKEMQQEQLAKLKLPEVSIVNEQLYAFTAGNPFLARQLVKVINTLEHDLHLALQDLALSEAFRKECLTILNSYLSKILQKVPQDLQLYLHKLSPLRFYRVEALRIMLESDPNDEKKYVDVRLLQILRRLESETDVVWWDNGRNAYITVSVIRRIMNQVNRLKDKAQFIQNHLSALAMYWDLVERFPENRSIYLAEICFHQATVDQSQSIHPKTVTDFKRILTSARNLPLDKRMILPNQIETDIELEDILSEKQYQNVKRQLQALLPSS